MSHAVDQDRVAVYQLVRAVHHRAIEGDPPPLGPEGRAEQRGPRLPDAGSGAGGSGEPEPEGQAVSKQKDPMDEIHARMSALKQRQDDAAEARRRLAERRKQMVTAIHRATETLRGMFESTGIGLLNGWDLKDARSAGRFDAAFGIDHAAVTGNFTMVVRERTGELHSLVCFALVPVERPEGWKCEIRHDDDPITPDIAFGICADLAERHFYNPEEDAR
jgi:hypothetical protein